MPQKTAVLQVLFFLLFSHGAFSTELPEDWKSWERPTTPLTKVGALPDCTADVSALPPIYQETVATYCAVKEGGPGKVAILVRPSELSTFEKRSGGYKPGVNLLLHLVDMGLVFATEHTKSEPVYHVFKESGESLVFEQPGHPLADETCQTCHTGYSSYCSFGQCGIKQ